MSNEDCRQITIRLPQYLLQEVDKMIKHDGVNRSDFIHQAATKYLFERKQQDVIEHMRQGYVEMANINLNLAAESFVIEEECELQIGRRLVSGV
ncbi:programmed cell death antitoxin YdcD [Geomicrobium sp. JCM 19037]|uniref:CopG family ribbon-helix-helix protein n=1 Tax=unclassified Geomicrobium TaxID=2628951 RepID=UPI00045F10A2|nr:MULTISPECIES: ribbon-helix-helix protein, CopG family [unclassified Geomicrobium]GAK04401.1 programmed cell death antitoxin YdcD [Geomicrobium sp. JCM 19037]